MAFKISVRCWGLMLLVACSAVSNAQGAHPGHEGGRGEAMQHHEGGRGGESMRHSEGRPSGERAVRRDHYGPPRGRSFASLPAGSFRVAHRSGNFFFRGGVWYRPYGGRFIVTLPPIGVFVPFLPPYYSNMWIGGVPYYYANGVYYAPGPGQGYVVAAPPPGYQTAGDYSTDQVATDPMQPIVYPRNGQSAQQTARDRQDCNIWANAQPYSASDPQIYQRGMAACLEGRGYTVR
jgi:hypothetical protein